MNPRGSGQPGAIRGGGLQPRKLGFASAGSGIIRSILLGIAALAVVSCQKEGKAPEPVYPIPTPAQVNWQKMETYAFVHFGLNTFNDLEWGYGDTPAETFNPTDLDAEQWVRIIKAAGFKGVILTAKHHDGFNLWPSKYTEYSVKNSPWRGGKGDMVRDLVNACRKYGLKFGLYLSPWDRNHAEYGKPGYTEYFQNQIQELITEYCDSIELFEYWFDGANGGDGYYGGAREKRSIDPDTYYQYERAVEFIHSKFPDAMIFGGTEPTIRWVGNEEGWAGQTDWAPFKSGDNPHYGSPDGTEWLPAECDVSIRPGWFYHAREDQSVRSLSHLVNIYYQSVGRNATLLMNFPVALSGKIHPLDSARIMEWRKTLDEQFETNLLAGIKPTVNNERGSGFKAAYITDGDWDSYWATEDTVKTGTVEFAFDTVTPVNRLLLQEYIPLGQRVAKFGVEYLDTLDKWQPVDTEDTMTTVGYKRIIRFETAAAKALRVNFTESRGPLCINNIEAYLAPVLVVEPSIRRNAEGTVFISAAPGAEIRYTTDGSAPTVKSPLFREPFGMARKGTVKAISVDPTLGKHSPVASHTFDIPTAAFKVVTPAGEKSLAAFDGNPSTAWYLLLSKSRELVFDLGGTYTVTGLTYAPDANRWGMGPVSRYRIYVGDKEVASGEFSNIKANPIEQVVTFAEPVEGSRVRFVVDATADGAASASFAELTVLTQ